MRRIATVMFLVVAAAPLARPCGFIESAANTPTFREETALCHFLLVGRMENPRTSPDGKETTDFVVTQAIKTTPSIKAGDVIKLSRLVKLPGPKEPQEFLVFGEMNKGEPDLYRGDALTPGLLDYVKGSLKIDPKDRIKLMHYAFDFMEDKDRSIRDDSYQTFVKSTDPDIWKASKLLSAEKLRGWLQAEGTAAYKRRLYAYLLAGCGDKSDAAFLRKLLDKWVKSDDPGNLDGALTAYILLDAKAGLAYTRDFIKDPAQSFVLRYAGLRTARYFLTTHPGILTKYEILGLVALLLKQGDMADLPINDLRTWREWSLTEDILGLYGKKDFDAKIVSRAIVRYALQCPDPKAAKFIAELRKKEPLFVEDQEQWLKDQAERDRPDIVVADFEGETYPDGWKTTGTAFGKGPARGTLPNQMPVSGFQGKGLVNSFAGGDGSTGTLTSPAFKVERTYLNFLIGGGKHAKTCINLLVDGKVVRTATGPNDKPGGSERLDWYVWDLNAHVGKEAVIQIVDDEKGGWGHINVDHIVQSDAPKQLALISRLFEVETRYLHLPVKNGAPMRRMKFVADKETVREFDIELADGEAPDFWAFADVSAFRGKRLSVDTVLTSGSKALDALKLADDVPDAEKAYREKHRPLFHFTSRVGWLNDPNGLVYHDGEWHLFYQHNPFGTKWGNMHWGHAVSKDLVKWQELGIGLYPKKYGDWAFSGSAVVDTGNTSGWGTKEKPPLVLAYTSTGRGECIAYSNDKGRTWTEYDKNPVVKHAGRDPKLVWYEKGKHWVMAVYDEHDKKQWIAFYTSPDLKTWTFASRIEGFYECPDLFPLVPQGYGLSSSHEKWILYGADGKYFVGDFDGKTFKPVFKEKKQLWYGNFYAAQTFDGTPRDGFVPDARIQIGWARGVTFPGMPFNQQMTVPVHLRLASVGANAHLTVMGPLGLGRLHEKNPVFEVWELKPLKLSKESTLGDELDAFDVELVLTLDKPVVITLDLRGSILTYDGKKGTLSCKGVTAPVEPFEGKLYIRALVDRGSVEVFAGSGAGDARVAMSVAAIPDEKNRKLTINPQGDEITIHGRVYRMKSAWEK